MSPTDAELAHPPSFAPFQGSARGSRPDSLRPAAMAVSSVALYRLAAAAGVGSAVVLLINAAKRSGVIATTDLTQLLAPVAEILARYDEALVEERSTTRDRRGPGRGESSTQ